MTRTITINAPAGALLTLVLALGAGGCADTPTAEAAPAAPTVDAVTAEAHFGSPVKLLPPGAEREVRELLTRWEDAWNRNDAAAYARNYAVDADFVNPLGGLVPGRQAIQDIHIFLFGGAFRGSSQKAEVRRLVPLTGTLVLVDLNTSLTGFQALPPGLTPTEPGVVWTRGRVLVGKNGRNWEIVAQQLTRMNQAP